MVSTSVFISEIHYDNSGTDTGEFIEIAGPAGTDLTGWKILLYNGLNGFLYSSLDLTGVISNQDDGFGTLAFAYPENGIQNGAPDGIALVDPGSNVVQFLSYEGSFVAADGAAVGMASTDIGVSETGSEAAGQSLQLSGTGRNYEDFAWNSPFTASLGAVNAGMDFVPSVQYTVLQFPAVTNAEAGIASEVIYGRIFHAGFTEAAGASADVIAQLGYGPQGSDPAGNSAWSWVDASFNTQYGNDDEYQGTLAIPRIGSYSYTFRFAIIQGGVQSAWTFADLDGNGSNGGLSFSTGQLGGITIGYHIVDGGPGPDNLPGTAADDQISGFDDNDTLDGLEGNDYLLGGAGDDILIGGPGDDILDGGSDTDTASYLDATAGVTVDLAVNTIQDTGGAGMDTLTGIENVWGTRFSDQLYGDSSNNEIDGRGSNDTINGGFGDDVISGSGGNDTIDGGPGADTINGGTGTDVIAGGDGADTIVGGNLGDVIHGGEGNDSIEGGLGLDQIFGDAGDDTIRGQGAADTIHGGEGNDTIFGDLHNDSIFGEAGNDHIYGGNGKDISTGGTGADTFHYNVNDFAAMRGAGADRITDFSQAEGDIIDLSVIDAAIGPGQGGNQAFTFIGAAAFGGNPGELHYVQDAGSTYIEGDRNGDMVADFALALSGLYVLQASDFVL